MLKGAEWSVSTIFPLKPPFNVFNEDGESDEGRQEAAGRSEAGTEGGGVLSVWF